MPGEISPGIVQFPLAPSLRAAGSPHLMLSTQIRLGEVSASVGTPGRSNSRSPAAGASPLGRVLHEFRSSRQGSETHCQVTSKGINSKNMIIKNNNTLIYYIWLRGSVWASCWWPARISVEGQVNLNFSRGCRLSS